LIAGEGGFFTAPNGQRGAMLRAYDKANGNEVGAVFMPAPQTGSPMTYMLNDKQYLVVAVSGGTYSGELIALRAPSTNSKNDAAAVTTTPPPAAVAQVAGRSVWDGVYSEQQANHGRETYKTLCASCHGESLAGVEAAPALTGDTFNANWSGTTVGSLAERIRISMPLDKPGTLSSSQLADIIAYVLKVDGFPAGSQALDAHTVTSTSVRILSQRP
jgi:quinoprotein glucose dehydrogenase